MNHESGATGPWCPGVLTQLRPSSGPSRARLSATNQWQSPSITGRQSQACSLAGSIHEVHWCGSGCCPSQAPPLARTALMHPGVLTAPPGQHHTSRQGPAGGVPTNKSPWCCSVLVRAATHIALCVQPGTAVAVLGARVIVVVAGPLGRRRPSLMRACCQRGLAPSAVQASCASLRGGGKPHPVHF